MGAKKVWVKNMRSLSGPFARKAGQNKKRYKLTLKSIRHPLKGMSARLPFAPNLQYEENWKEDSLDFELSMV